jgi:hypothetical protein
LTLGRQRADLIIFAIVTQRQGESGNPGRVGLQLFGRYFTLAKPKSTKGVGDDRTVRTAL